MLQPGCMACDVLSGKTAAPGGVIFKTACWTVDHQVMPASVKGFLIVKPNRHCEHIGELTADEASELGEVLQRSCAAVRSALGAGKVYVLSFGEAVLHVHFYIIPRYPGMPANGHLVLQGIREGEWRCTEAEAADAADRVREAIGH